MSYPADPLVTRQASRAEISYSLSSASGRKQNFIAPYNPIEMEWQRPDQPFQGLALYSDYSGGVAVWDPLLSEGGSKRQSDPYLQFSRQEIWDGSRPEIKGRRSFISNGLIADWVSWTTSPEHADTRKVFETCLRHLSPPDGEHLAFGKRNARIPGGSREIPTIRLSYGNVPILYVSAGIQRILTLAYMLVWNWQRHLSLAEYQRREPLRTMVIIIDEIEAHLHPRWQRQIIPALLGAMHEMQRNVSVQLHISTHSPLVLASTEPLFDSKKDQIHHLKFAAGEVRLEEFNDWKHGSVDYWLQSDVFGLKEPRSKPAEEIIARATQAQLSGRAHDLDELQKELIRLLPDDDPFWPRWISFYEASARRKSRSRR